MKIKGKYNEVIIYNDNVEETAISQIYEMLNSEAFSREKIRIMPDVHCGKGSVIGFTMSLGRYICPSIVGVDIGCGVSAWKLGSKHTIGNKFDKLDKFIRENIPSGRNVREGGILINQERLFKDCSDIGYLEFLERIFKICKDRSLNYDYVMKSLGTLGGGNHFIEIDEDNEENYWLIIHSGSRNFGLKVALSHQSIADTQTLTMSREEFDAKVTEIKRTKKGKSIAKAIDKLKKTASVRKHKRTGLEFLKGEEAENYYFDMRTAQHYADLNRRIMGYKIIKYFYELEYNNCEFIQSVHNYINFDDKIIRKGAISAHKSEKVIIPLNMADGCIIGVGKGNKEWNCSAPHGAGRKMSRTNAKANVSLEDFQKVMKKSGVWSSCINKSTLDESPQAYKKASDIINYLEPSVTVTCHMKPIYNFKSGE